jgi:AcrR family transcriptional regulator
VATSASTWRARLRPYTPAQRRTIDAALDLFGSHGVGGTSLQMLADAVGVTKAAIYHQFKTKDAIVVAVLETELERLDVALAAAEHGRSGTSGAPARDLLLRRVVAAAVERRSAWNTLQNDPVFVRLLSDHEPSREFWARLFRVLTGGGRSARSRVRAAVLSSAIGAAAHPFVVDLDDATLRRELVAVIEPLLES